MRVREVLKVFLVGFLIGVAFVLPGISGAVIAVVFGIYERMLHVISDLRRNLRRELKFVIILALGLVVGVILFSAIVDRIPEEFESILLLAFVGLIIGQVPEVYKLARKDGEPVKNQYIVWLVIGFIVLLPLLLFDTSGVSERGTEHDFTGIMLALAVGLIMGSTALVPGLNGPTILTALGIYGIFTGVMGNLDLVLLLPLGIGALIGMIFVSKILVRILDSHYYPMYYVILGLTVCSILLTFFEVDSDVNVLYGAIALIAGLAISLLFTYFEMNLPESETLDGSG